MWPLPGFVNLDVAESKAADVRADCLRLPFLDGSLDEIYAGHVVEHLERGEAAAFVAECLRCLRPGGALGVVVPDTRAIMSRYVNGPALLVEFHPCAPVLMEPRWVSTDDLDDVCAGFLYSTLQDSGHKWSYDARTLGRLLGEGGFRIEREINRWFDPRIPVGAWYQCGLQAVKER